MGIEVHLRRVEVLLGDFILVRARPRPASPRATPHRLCPAERRCRLLRCRQLQITDAAQRSTCGCTDPRGRPAPSPSSAPRSWASPRRSAARSAPSLCCPRSSGCCRWCCRPLRGGVELQGGDPGNCGGAARQQLSSGGSGGPPARHGRLWRRRAARLLRLLPQLCICKKVWSVAAHFLALCVRLCVSHAHF